MKIAFFSAKSYDREFFDKCNITYEIVCTFVNDKLSADVIEALERNGVQLIALRCAGFNNVYLEAAKAMGLRWYGYLPIRPIPWPNIVWR
jgi:D-lactate dehydrogenase